MNIANWLERICFFSWCELLANSDNSDMRLVRYYLLRTICIKNINTFIVIQKGIEFAQISWFHCYLCLSSYVSKFDENLLYSIFLYNSVSICILHCHILSFSFSLFIQNFSFTSMMMVIALDRSYCDNIKKNEIHSNEWSVEKHLSIKINGRL